MKREHQFNKPNGSPFASNFLLSAIEVDFDVFIWEIPTVKTLTVDARKRIRIPDAKPRQLFAYENNGDGTLTLTQVKTEVQERFPSGSLKKYLTADRDKEQLSILKNCVLARP